MLRTSPAAGLSAWGGDKRRERRSRSRCERENMAMLAAAGASIRRRVLAPPICGMPKIARSERKIGA
jgi:hypothetical protein